LIHIHHIPTSEDITGNYVICANSQVALIEKGNYMVAQRHEFYFLALKTIIIIILPHL